MTLKTTLQKTNAIRLLDQAKIHYELTSFEVDQSDLSATHAAELLGISPSVIFKTLLLKGDKIGIFVAVIPADKALNLKLTARMTGNKNVELLPLKELLPTTGYIKGGCSPIGMKKLFPTFIHCSCLNFKQIYISAGKRGLDIIITPEDLISFIKAEVVDIVI